MALIRPRLNDFHNLPFTQEEADFAIPFLDEDLPLFIDPFLLWKSPSLQDESLHSMVINAFNHLGYLVNKGKEDEASKILITASECNEVGLGSSRTRTGHRIGVSTANQLLSLFKNIPQIKEGGFTHIEEVQLYVDQISSDRISDFTANFIKSFLVDYTIDQCNKHGIPLNTVEIQDIYNHKKNTFIETEEVGLPVNPTDGRPLLLVPKRWLRYSPWINYEDYFTGYYQKETEGPVSRDKVSILNFNRHHYDAVRAYIAQKERQQADCKNDPLFKPIPISSAKGKLKTIKALPSGKTGNADKKYEDNVVQLLASLLYPHLDFAQEQARSEDGVTIRDLIFYNNRSFDFLKDIYDDYESRQIVFELKNVKKLDREHVFQLNRYLNDQLGKFGVLITRNKPPKAIEKNLISLWSGQRRCIIVLTDEDIELMVNVFESKQRSPIEVLKKKYIEFTRTLPT